MPFVLLLTNDRMKRITDTDRRHILDSVPCANYFVRLEDGSWVNISHIVSIEKN